MTVATRVFLIDDHHVLRQGIARMLDQEADITVVGQAGDAQSGIRSMEALQPYPDVVVIDLKMPGQSGMSAIADIIAAHPDTRIIVFTMYDNPG